MGRKEKIRVNISVDRELLEKAKGKLNLFGGKLSTLFNAYLSEFVKSIDKISSGNYEKIKELDGRLSKIERNFRKVKFSKVYK